MKRSFWCAGMGSVFALTAAVIGCAPSNKVKAGAPVMLSCQEVLPLSPDNMTCGDSGFLVVDPGGNRVQLVTEAGVQTAPPLSIFYVLFDRLLDPTALQEEPDGGVSMPKAGVALFSWSGTPAIEANTLYIPNGDAKHTLIPQLFGLPLANGPSLTIMPQMGLPSGSEVTVALDQNKVRSHDQKTPFVAAPNVSATLTFTTDPLMVGVDVPPVPDPPDGGAGDDAGTDDAGAGDGGTGPLVAPPVDPDYVAHVSFNNLTSDSTLAEIQVTGTVGGTPLVTTDVVVARDEMSPTGWTVSPPAAGWPPGAVVAITIGAAAADNFGQTLGAPATASFTVKP